MIPKLIFDKEKNRKGYRGTDEEFEKFCKLFDTFSEFSFDAYHDNANCLLSCFDGYEDWHQPHIVDYGYALTPEAVEKYILANYGDNNPNKYFIEVGLMSFDHEKPWKQGTYIDKDGNNTQEDYYDVEGIEEEMKHPYIDNRFITFSVHDLTNKR